MLEDLDKAITKLSNKTDVDIHLVGFKKHSDNLIVNLNLTYCYEEEIQEEWQIVCEDSATHRFEYEVFEEWETFNEHEFLWNFNKQWGEIYFNGSTNPTSEVIGELYKTHNDNTQGYLPFGEYINFRIDKLLEGGTGLFAKGPLNLLDSYRNVLTKYGYKTTILPLHYKNKQDYRLLVMGNSFVVAKNFLAFKV